MKPIQGKEIHDVIQKDIVSPLGFELPIAEEELFQLDKYPIFDYEEGMVRTGGSESGLKKLLKLAINDVMPVEIANLKAAYDRKDWEKIQELSHKLKGGSVYCGTIRMTFACQYMERYYKAGHRKLLERLYQQLITTMKETETIIKPIINTLSE